MMGKMTVNDLAKSSVAGVTAQLQVYRRVGMHSAAAVSDIGRNHFLDQQSVHLNDLIAIGVVSVVVGIVIGVVVIYHKYSRID